MGEVGHELLVLLLQLCNLGEEILGFTSPDVFDQLQFLEEEQILSVHRGKVVPSLKDSCSEWTEGTWCGPSADMGQVCS